MSNSNGFELDFGFGSLLDTGNSNGNSTNNGNFAFGGGDYGTANLTSLANSMNMNGTQAQDFLSLFNDNFPSASSVTGTTTTSNTANTNNSVSNNWQKNAKALFDQQQQQQLLEQNSLNALLSQHTQQQQQQQNFLSDLDVTVNQTTQASSSAFAAASQQLNTSSGNNNGNNYMFVATIVDPNQEDAPPQQMLFLPGSNQVIPMPSGTGASAGNGSGNSNNGTANGGQQGLMALANLPVVFNTNNNQQQNSQQQQSQQQQQSFSNNFLLDRDSNWPAALQSLNASVAVNSNSNSNSMYSNNDDLLQQVAAQGLAPLDLTNFGNLGPTTSNSSSNDQSFQHLQLQQLQLQQSSLMMQHQNQQHVPSVSPASVPQEEKAAMPIRPLSAYNFFFSDERERILLNKTEDDDDVDAELDNAKKQRLLLQHLAKDRSKRRPHRKTHGKINFTTLSKLIGQRWKQLPEDRKNFYREVAAIDLERYQRELRERSPANGNAAAN